MDMVMRGGRICLVGFANEPVSVDVAKLVRNHLWAPRKIPLAKLPRI
jgi:hypothetical protein